MMEQWNIGMMGSGIMQCWINGPAIGGIGEKIKMASIHLKTNIPLFHFRANSEAPKNLYILSRL